MKKIILLAIILCITKAGQAQSNIDNILHSIESNNSELRANQQTANSQKLQNRTDNNLPDPGISYSHLWGEKSQDGTVGELIVSQSFDFPTLYAARARTNRLKDKALDAQNTAFRQELLLQAKELCFDIILLQQQQKLLEDRLQQTRELVSFFQARLEKGDANILETNKVKLELLNIQTETRMNQTLLESKWKDLTAMNDNQPFKIDSIFQVPLPLLPADYEQLRNEVLNSDMTLQSLNSLDIASRRQIAVDRQGWLPAIELGYRRNTESGIPFNGIVVGFSVPLFQNRNKVKRAKARSQSITYQKESVTQQAKASLKKLYNEGKALQMSIQEYQEALHLQQNISLLKQALTGGQINVTEYFMEVTIVYQSKQNLLQLENRYQKVIARIYKNKEL